MYHKMYSEAFEFQTKYQLSKITPQITFEQLQSQIEEQKVKYIRLPSHLIIDKSILIIDNEMKLNQMIEFFGFSKYNDSFISDKSDETIQFVTAIDSEWCPAFYLSNSFHENGSCLLQVSF